MKKISVNQMLEIKGGGFWRDLAEGFCAGYGAVRTVARVASNLHPVAKVAVVVADIGCAAVGVSSLVD